MNTQGPYFIHPYATPITPRFGMAQLDIPIQIGTRGSVEIINLTNFNLRVSLQSKGTAFQEGRSKVLYTTTAEQLGTQMLHLSTDQLQQVITSANYTRQAVSYQNGETGILPIWVNTYEEGEIEPYPPVSISNPPAQSIYYASAIISANGTLVLPTTSTFYQTIVPSEGTCSLIGFDATATLPGAADVIKLVISNLNNQPDGSTVLNYFLGQLVSATEQVMYPLHIQFPAPIPNLGGAQITFTVTSTSNSTINLNAYYSLT